MRARRWESVALAFGYERYLRSFLRPGLATAPAGGILLEKGEGGRKRTKYAGAVFEYFKRREGKGGRTGTPSGSSGSRVDEGFVNNRAAIRRPGETRTHVDSGQGALPLLPFFVGLPLHHRLHLFLCQHPPSPSSLIFLLLLPFLLRILLITTTSSSTFSSLASLAASFLPLPSQRGRGRNILDVYVPRGIEGRLPSHDNWWVSVSWFGREVSPGPPTRRSQTTTTTKRPLAVTHGVLPSSGVPTYSGYQRTERPNEASVDAAHPNGPDLSARKTHAQQLNTFTSYRPTK
ncbi:hypothetical protein ALC56_15204 [Trachymyrmex septentrionalis]|uniref:Uncharacterized protein n=1 Tax=Trachymyrmex septentrionalis TaxID=34720 RepID=A0A195EQL7_9HYME|nr:hypothetical protein ALC56_15204 [Trachymyrmex septentrionalis]